MYFHSLLSSAFVASTLFVVLEVDAKETVGLRATRSNGKPQGNLDRRALSGKIRDLLEGGTNGNKLAGMLDGGAVDKLLATAKQLEEQETGANPEDFLGNLFAQWQEIMQFGDLECPMSGEAGTPECGYGLDGEVGVWVCRTITNPFMPTGRQEQSNTMCVPPEYTMGAVDQCGSCDGTYPSACECPCVQDNGNDGVRVLTSFDFLGQEFKMEECMEPNLSVSIVDSVPFLSCITDCSAPVEQVLPWDDFEHEP